MSEKHLASLKRKKPGQSVRKKVLAASIGLLAGVSPIKGGFAQQPAASSKTPENQQSPPPSPLAAPEPSSPFTGTIPVLRLAPESPAAETKKIVEIVVKGGKTVTPETVGFYLGVKAGDDYSEETLQRNFLKLWDSGLFEDVSLEKEIVSQGIRIIATISERPRVVDLEFRGNKKLTTSQMKDKLKEGKVEIKVGGPISLRDVAKAKAVLLEAYKAEGFRSAVVDATIEDVSEMERRVVFVIDEGDKIKIKSISFSGNTVFSASKLRGAMKKTKEGVWWKFWSSKDVYNQANYEEDVESLKKVYQNAGYKDVVVKDPVVETFVVNPEEKRPGKTKRRAKLTIPIVEGEQFYLGKLSVEGSTVIAGEALQSLFVTRPGKPLNRGALTDGMKSIETLYRERGYIYIYSNPEYTDQSNHVVDVTIKITEGDQFRLGRVEFSGNKTTKDKVLRREMIVNEGDILDMEALKKAIFKITQLGYFKIEEDPDFRVNPDLKTVDVTIKGQDTNRNEIQFGAGYSPTDGLFGQFQFATRNFLGRGDTLGVQFQRGGYSNYFDLSFTEPWFLDQRMSIGGSIFNRTYTYLDVDQRTRGLNLSLGLGLGLFDGVSLFYGFTDSKSRYEVFPPPAPPGAGTPPPAYADYTGKTSAITPGYRYDSRNDPFDPNRGRRIGASVTIAGGLFGGDYSYVKPLANATWYFPVTRKSYAGVNAQVGLIRPYDGQEIPIFERFRIGGDRSVRGYQSYSIFPLNDNDQAYFNSQGAILGGDRFIVFNLEYVFILGGPLKLAAFLDGGNTWIEEQSIFPLRMRSAAGLELRIFLPIFQAPLRFIYGVKLDPKVLKDQNGFVLVNGVESRTDFQFSVGTTF